MVTKYTMNPTSMRPVCAHGDRVIIRSETSKHRGKLATVLCYCKGVYANICRVQLDSGETINYFDTSLERRRLP